MNKRKILYLIITFIISIIVTSCKPSANQSLEEIKTEITKVMDAQETSWNEGNMEEYMQGYWKSDSLRFLSNNRLTFGWEQQLANYKKGYPDQSTMGKLKFEIISIEKLGDEAALVIGTYNLERLEIEDAFGYYSLIWKKKNNRWLIVFDHSS
jgi:hypothetical protein